MDQTNFNSLEKRNHSSGAHRVSLLDTTRFAIVATRYIDREKRKDAREDPRAFICRLSRCFQTLVYSRVREGTNTWHGDYASSVSFDTGKFWIMRCQRYSCCFATYQGTTQSLSGLMKDMNIGNFAPRYARELKHVKLQWARVGSSTSDKGQTDDAATRFDSTNLADKILIWLILISDETQRYRNGRVVRDVRGHPSKWPIETRNRDNGRRAFPRNRLRTVSRKEQRAMTRWITLLCLQDPKSGIIDSVVIWRRPNHDDDGLADENRASRAWTRQVGR